MLKKHIGFALTVIAIVLFFPGILAPMFSLNMELAGSLSGASMATELVSKEQSIIGTVTELFHEQRYLVAFLIFAFSVLIPLFKTIIVAIVYFTKNQLLQRKLAAFVAAIGKWSMADVFVVAIFLAVMSTNHSQSREEHELSFLGMSLDFVISTETLSNVGNGFYFFVGYCLISLLGSQLLMSAVHSKNAEHIDNN